VHNKLRKQVEDRMAELEGDKYALKKITAEIKRLKLERKKRERLENNQQDKDYVEMNIERLY
jgi:regulator of replication initiation timing